MDCSLIISLLSRDSICLSLSLFSFKHGDEVLRLGRFHGENLRVSVAPRLWLLPGRPLVQARIGDEFGEVVHVDAVAHARVFIGSLNDSNIAIAVVIARNRAMQNPKRFNFAAAQANNLVAILRFSSVSIVHICFLFIGRNCPNWFQVFGDSADTPTGRYTSFASRICGPE
jgi:hypothetical protein